MKKRLSLTLRIFVLLLILPLLGIAFAPPAKINAICNSTGAIKVENGLISANSGNNFTAIANTNVNCITEDRALIKQSDILSYDEMKTDYYDKAKSTYYKKPVINGSTTSAYINLSY